MKSSGLQGQYAGFLSRLIGFFADVILIALTDTLAYLLVSALLFQFTGYSIYACPAPGAFTLKAMSCHVTSWGYSVFLTGFPLVYVLFFWILLGQTIGQYVAGVRVVRLNGHRMTLVSSAIRLFGYFVCFFSLLIDDRRQGWHDKLAGTVVIYAWEARQDARFLGRLSQRLFGRTQQS
jgi:uncharacterized RDD family membrane protein YckC